MTTFAYIEHVTHDGEGDGGINGISLLVIRQVEQTLKIICRPVRVPNLDEHRARLPAVFAKKDDERPSKNLFLRFTKMLNVRMPPNYSLMESTGMYIVFDGSGNPIGVFDKPEAAMQAAWNRFDSNQRKIDTNRRESSPLSGPGD